MKIPFSALSGYLSTPNLILRAQPAYEAGLFKFASTEIPNPIYFFNITTNCKSIGTPKVGM